MDPTAPGASERPSATTRWRCRQCGNLTRFDVVRRARVQEYVHQTLAGEPSVEETVVLEEVVEQVRCRWCGGVGTVELVPRPDAEPTAGEAAGTHESSGRTAGPVTAPGASAGAAEASVRTAGPVDATAGGAREADRP